MSSMFWGLKLEPGKRYSTTVDKSFHISMAALDCSSVKKDGEFISVMVEEEGGAYIICNLNKESILQSHLDLNFMTGDRITLFCKGQGVVHLSGYMVPDDEDEFPSMMDEEEEGEEEEEEEEDDEVSEKVKNVKKQVKGVKRGLSPEETSPKKKSKQMSLQKDMSDEEEDDDDEAEDEEDTDDSFGDDFDMEEAEDEEDEDESDEEEQKEEEKPTVSLTKSQKKKQKKKQQQLNASATKQTPNKQENQKLTNGATGTPGSIKKKEKKKGAEGGAASPEVGKQGEQQQQQKKTMTGGVEVKELKVGNGPVCKPGKMVVVYYTGRLKSNNKVFDSVTQGSGFKFRLGKGEVIKGWDIGLSGMKVGGKRSITCPPQAAYGQKGAPPSIPPNSTLVFDVELRAVN